VKSGPKTAQNDQTCEFNGYLIAQQRFKADKTKNISSWYFVNLVSKNTEDEDIFHSCIQAADE